MKRIEDVLDASTGGIQLSLDDWLSAGTLCDLRITTHTGRMILKRARVIWTRRVGERCVSGLELCGVHRAARPQRGLITLFDDDVPKGRGDGEGWLQRALARSTTVQLGDSGLEW